MSEGSLFDHLPRRPAIVQMHDGTSDDEMQHGDLFLSVRETVEIGRFDCTGIDRDFLIHTGREFRSEIDAAYDGGNELALPYASCLFEFADEIVAVEEVCTCWGGVMSNEVAAGREEYAMKAHSQAIHGVVANKRPVSSILTVEEIAGNYEDNSFIVQTRSDWLVERQYSRSCSEEFKAVNVTAKDESKFKDAADLVLGVLCLLSERLLLKEHPVSGQSTTKNARARASGKSERHQYRILKLNLAEAKHRARKAAIRQHESPRLHWRRGHWRTLHRGSEFEGRTWIKRCLVGDPDRGFVSKHYQVKLQPTIH